MGYNGVYDYSFHSSNGQYVITRIISTADFARNVMEATPDMGGVVGNDGFQNYFATYLVPEIVGVIEPDPTEFSDSKYALVLSRLKTKREVVYYPGWQG